MKRNWRYFKYLVRHKWYVLVAGVRIGAPLWLLLVHDLSKFLPSEWVAYLEWFYPEGERNNGDGFDRAWLGHQNRNKHHWQYWVLLQDDGMVGAVEMPEEYMLEMVADWMGAGRAISGEWDYVGWYEENRRKMLVHERTEARVSKLIYESECLFD